MRIGIIAEGRGDLAVISNILRGRLGIDFEDIQFLRPQYALDETDLHSMSEAQFSNWGLVKQECKTGSLLEEFLNSPIDEERLVVIHVDTAEAELAGYDVTRPSGSTGDASIELHRRVAAKLDEWLSGRKSDQFRYAIAIEETEAWILTLYQKKETSTARDPKKALKKVVGQRHSDKERKQLSQMSAYEHHDKLSRDFRKRSTLADCATRNHSLRLFLESFASNEEG
ncbi:hypothetical protein [Archangium violaceum]|uniref:Uncharacterized protein n=1 Tax=Archangium violaceum Cb vi76 TaxID=1406225 RepID=A0A084SRI3_9BACT|nr:hypothetical protein [Archangium violaceum]KFA91068.1 hypothetical protein Q664_24795 [Archangium violaceum Cb vi76]